MCFFVLLHGVGLHTIIISIMQLISPSMKWCWIHIEKWKIMKWSEPFSEGSDNYVKFIWNVQSWYVCSCGSSTWRQMDTKDTDAYASDLRDHYPNVSSKKICSRIVFHTPCNWIDLLKMAVPGELKNKSEPALNCYGYVHNMAHNKSHETWKKVKARPESWQCQGKSMAMHIWLKWLVDTYRLIMIRWVTQINNRLRL